MRKLLFVLLAATFVVGLTAPLSYACGDKFLVSSRTMDRSYTNTHAGVIALYRMPFDKNLKKSLENRGHKVEYVESAQDLEKKVQNGKVDLVLMPVDDALAMGQQNHPMVMPVSFGDSQEIAKLKADFEAVLTGKAKTSKKTDEIDEAMKTAK